MENIEEYRPFFATIDGVKKGPFSPNELSAIFQKGGFKSILLSNNQEAIDKQKRQIKEEYEVLEKRSEKIDQVIAGIME